MSTVHVFVGQCGNQLGNAFLDTLVSDTMSVENDIYQTLVSSTHFRRPLKMSRSRGESTLKSYTEASPLSLPQPRCVMIDMEPKVIEQVMERVNVNRSDGEMKEGRYNPNARMPDHNLPGSSLCRSSQQHRASQGSDATATTHSMPRPLYRLAPQQCVTRGEGSANNWAYGYYHQGESRREGILDCLRRENEASDTTVTTYHVLHSAAGGTGSGVGCLAAEVIQDSYPHSTLMHTLVWPFTGGEVVTQWYNLTLTLSTLPACCDAVLLLYNEESREAVMNNSATRSLRSRVRVSFDEINAHMSQLLTPLHLPQQLYAVPTPLHDRTRTRITSGSVSNNRSSRWARIGTVDERKDGAQGKLDPGVCAGRRVRSEDVVEALALDPCRKFFVAAQSSAAGTASTTWSGVIQSAARLATDYFDVESLESSSGWWESERNLQHALCRSPGLCARSCLWALRGPRAATAGVQELRHVMATHRCSHNDSSCAFPISSLWVSLAEAAENGRAMCSGHEVSLYGPSSRIGEHMAAALRRTEQLLSVNAFVHHFETNGVSKSELRDAAATLWETVDAYTPHPP